VASNGTVQAKTWNPNGLAAVANLPWTGSAHSTERLTAIGAWVTWMTPNLQTPVGNQGRIFVKTRLICPLPLLAGTWLAGAPPHGGRSPDTQSGRRRATCPGDGPGRQDLEAGGCGRQEGGAQCILI
jgi:hypothetical protein